MDQDTKIKIRILYNELLESLCREHFLLITFKDYIQEVDSLIKTLLSKATVAFNMFKAYEGTDEMLDFYGKAPSTNSHFPEFILLIKSPSVIAASSLGGAKKRLTKTTSKQPVIKVGPNGGRYYKSKSGRNIYVK